MKRVILDKLAKSEIRVAAKYLDQQRPGLGKAFLAEITAVLDYIGQFPFAAPVVWEQFRRARVNRFRYDVVYAVEDERIIVVAVPHQRREPDAWKDRL